jgi:DHA2 family methylenomycin A resistance protein-like MFS transporter
MARTEAAVRPSGAQSAASAAAPNSDTYPERSLLAAVALTMMLAPLNSTMIVIALPRIVRDTGTTVSTGGLLVTAYLVAMAACQPVAGTLGDRWGRRPTILCSLLLFGVVSVCASLAPNLWALLLFRVLQALSAGIALPNGMALLREAIPAERRGSSFGLIGSAAGIAAACGPPLGGFLTQAGGWRSIFLVNVVLVAPALVIGWRSFPRLRPVRRQTRFDVAGAGLLTTVLVGLAALLIRVPDQPVVLSIVWAVVVVAIGAAFFLREMRAADPVLQLRLFRIRTISAGNVCIALSNLAMYVTLLAVPLLEGGRGRLDPLHVGLLLAAMSACNFLGAPLGGRLADRFGRRLPTFGGLAISVPPLFVLAVSGGDLAVALFATCLAVAGFGFGLGWSGLQTAVVESVPVRQAGMASGLFSTSRYFGSIVGSSVLAGVVGSGQGDWRFVVVFSMCCAAALLSALASFGLHVRPLA